MCIACHSSAGVAGTVALVGGRPAPLVRQMWVGGGDMLGGRCQSKCLEPALSRARGQPATVVQKYNGGGGGGALVPSRYNYSLADSRTRVPPPPPPPSCDHLSTTTTNRREGRFGGVAGGGGGGG